MLDKLLQAFVIREYGEGENTVYTVAATAKARKILGITEKQKRNNYGLMLDTIDERYYISALVTYIARTLHIEGLLRESKGNGHDASWQKEIIVCNGGGSWKEEFDKYRIEEGGLYVYKPIVKDVEKITDELIENWAQSYDLSFDGEEPRHIYCSGVNDTRIDLVIRRCSVAYSDCTPCYWNSGSNLYITRAKGANR